MTEKNAADQRLFNVRKPKRIAALISAVDQGLTENIKISVRELALNNDVSSRTIFNIIYDEIGIVKKNSRWVPKLFSKGNKFDRIRSST